MMHTSPSSAPAAAPPVFVAREPILDRRQHVFGYQVRLREPASPEPGGSRTAEAARVVHGVHAIGLEPGQRAFVSVSRQLLLDGVPAMLPADRVVVELGADIDGDRQVQAACAELRSAHYRISLDRTALDDGAKQLLPFASYLKLDVNVAAGDARSRARTFSCLSAGVSSLVATGIETFEQFEAAAAEGFTGFQGFFFGRPALLQPRAVPGQQVAMLRVLQALNDPNGSIGQLEAIVKHDAGLCYRLLRTVNSAAASRRGPVESIRAALLLCGRDRVRRWASLWVLKGLNESAHAELVARSTVRARCCELLSATSREAAAPAEAFLLGMCSLLDAILDRPMASVVADLPLAPAARAALCGEANGLRPILDAVIAYERGAWEDCEAIAALARVNPAVLPAAFAEALRWFKEI
jgi:EAL and modified HD-GYP domain-containing signal transduction protein